MLVEEDAVPTISPQSSSLMEGSGEFDPSDFSQHDIERQPILPENYKNMLPDQKVADIPLDNEQNDSLNADFESTNLLVSGGVNMENVVPSNIEPLETELFDSVSSVDVSSTSQNAYKNLNFQDKSTTENAIDHSLKTLNIDDSNKMSDTETKCTLTSDTLDNVRFSFDPSANIENQNFDVTTDTGSTCVSSNLTNSVSTMSNSAASSTTTCVSKGSIVGLTGLENVGSESSELNSSMSSSNTTLFAAKVGIGSAISTDEGGDNIDDINPISYEKLHKKFSSQIQAIDTTAETQHENESILMNTNTLCDNEEDTVVHVIDAKDDDDRSSTPLSGNMSNLIENAMKDDDEDHQTVIDKDGDPIESVKLDSSKKNENVDQNSDPESHCSSIESSSKSYQLIQHESMISSTNSSFNVISKTSAIEENCQQNNQGNLKTGHNSSGHTSGDDLEVATTTTSSDIEVIQLSNISSPILGSENGNGNGYRRDYNSTGNSESLEKAACKEGFSRDKRSKDNHVSKIGHARSNSEVSAISACSDSVDSTKPESRYIKFQKKINDMTELLEARELKLVELSKQNMDIMEKNDDLVSQVKEARQINARLSDTHLASEEFTQRLSSMEQRLQQIIAERDTLKEENKGMKQEAALRMTKTQVEEIVTEKDEIIKDLMSEGESLSKQVGKQSEVIKKIRQKEKGLEKELKNTKEKLEKKVEECDRFKKSLAAKGEVETKQIEAVRDLTTANSTWQEEARKRDSELEDAKDQAAALRLSLESAFKEMTALKKTLSERDNEAREEELAKEQKMKKELQEELRRHRELAIAETENLQRNIDELRCTLADEERASARREEHLRRERDDIQQRLAMSDARHDDLSGSLSTATRPLLRQIESLQLSLSEAQANADRAERGLGERLQQTTIQLASCQERERATAEQYRQISARLAGMDSRLENSKRSQAESEGRAEALSNDIAKLEMAIHKEGVAMKALKNSFAEEVAELKKEKESLETAFESEKLVSHEERRKADEFRQQLAEKERKLKEVSDRDLENLRRMSENANRTTASPTPSLSSVSQRGFSLENENDIDEKGNSWMVSEYSQTH